MSELSFDELFDLQRRRISDVFCFFVGGDGRLKEEDRVARPMRRGQAARQAAQRRGRKQQRATPRAYVELVAYNTHTHISYESMPSGMSGRSGADEDS
jgi:hypothetical protein